MKKIKKIAIIKNITFLVIFLKGRWRTIKIEYKNKKLKKICEDFKQAKKILPLKVAEELHSLINLFNSSETLDDINILKIYNLHSLKGKIESEYSLYLGKTSGFRLIILPLDDNQNKWNTKDINIIYKETRIILILEVSNHYE